MEPEKTDHTKRDAETFLILGGFVVMLGLPVMLGTFWEPNYHAKVVNALAGISLLLIGGAMFAWGIKLRARHNASESIK